MLVVEPKRNPGRVMALRLLNGNHAQDHKATSKGCLQPLAPEVNAERRHKSGTASNAEEGPYYEVTPYFSNQNTLSKVPGC
jgi:hypothetical protein